VLLMIEAHTLDAWTRLDTRNTTGYRNLTVLGGFAAPLFLWLAGVGVAMAAARAARQAESRRAAVLAVARRGLEIFVLAFLFRIQSFLVTPGGPLLTIFRVDILNVMGPAMIVAGVLWGSVRRDRTRVLLFSVATAIVALITPVVRASAAVNVLPTWLQWYMRPAGDMTTFTLLPWAAFVFAGGAVGVLATRAGDERAGRQVHLALAACGALLIGIGFWAAARPTIYHASSFWTSSPTWFAIRLGILMVALSALYAAEQMSRRVPAAVWAWQIPLARFGRASLFVYWIHVELVYGYASWLWRHRLPLWATALGWVAFSTLMYGAVVLRDGVVSGRRRRPHAVTQAATA
jgi:uncharacterized membrane protein